MGGFLLDDFLPGFNAILLSVKQQGRMATKPKFQAAAKERKQN